MAAAMSAVQSLLWGSGGGPSAAAGAAAAALQQGGVLVLHPCLSEGMGLGFGGGAAAQPQSPDGGSAACDLEIQRCTARLLSVLGLLLVWVALSRGVHF